MYVSLCVPNSSSKINAKYQQKILISFMSKSPSIFKRSQKYIFPRIHCIPSYIRREQSLQKLTTAKISFCQACGLLFKSNKYWLGQLLMSLKSYEIILITHISNLDIWKINLYFSLLILNNFWTHHVIMIFIRRLYGTVYVI